MSSTNWEYKMMLLGARQYNCLNPKSTEDRPYIGVNYVGRNGVKGSEFGCPFVCHGNWIERNVF